MNRKEPLFRVVKRESSSPVRQALAYVAAVVIALLIGAANAAGVLLLKIAPSPSTRRW